MQNPTQSAPDALQNEAETGMVPITDDQLRDIGKGPDAPLETVVFTDKGKFRKPYTQVDVDRAAEFKAREMAGDIKLSRAQERLARLTAPDAAPSIERVEIEGDAEPWFIRRMDLEGLTRIGLMASRNRKGELFLAAEGHLRGLLAAMFYVALVEDESGAHPLFSDWTSAYDLAHSTNPEAVQVNSVLFERILALNPDILPKDKAESKSKSKEGDGDFLERSAAPPESSI